MKPVTIYTTSYCPHCARAKRLLQNKNIPFTEIDVTNDPKNREEIEKRTGWMTVPMIFIGGEFIGGADDLFSLDREGKLQEKLG